MKREIAKSRPESRPRPRQRRDFFLGFMFEPCSNTWCRGRLVEVEEVVEKGGGEVGVGGGWWR
jgi:hypothetical protein